MDKDISQGKFESRVLSLLEEIRTLLLSQYPQQTADSGGGAPPPPPPNGGKP